MAQLHLRQRPTRDAGEIAQASGSETEPYLTRVLDEFDRRLHLHLYGAMASMKRP